MGKIDHSELKVILNGCKKLQPKWQKRLYDLLFDSILLSVSKFGLTDEEAEDLMQETFIRVFNQLNTYDSSKSEITTWASTIAKRLTINYCNSKYKRNLKCSIDDLKNNHVISMNSNIDIDLEQLKLTLEQIPKKYREVFEMSVYQGMRHKAIAKQMNITESSSRVYLSRAVEFIKKDLKRLAI